MVDAAAAEVLELVGREWPGLIAAVDLAMRRGFRWDLCSTPFVHREGGRIVAHVGLIELPLVVAGRTLRVAGLHGAVVDPEHRGRGHLRRLMAEALDFADQRYQSVVLTAGEPEIYRRFGFEVVPEHRFVGAAPRPAAGGAPPLRDLDPDAPADLALLLRLLRDRAPVSRRLGVTRELPLFLLKTARQPLRHAADLDAVLFHRVEGRRLLLFDVVAERIPSLADIVVRVPYAVDEVEVQFAPDQLDAPWLRAEPWVVDGDEHLMARGPFLPPGLEACLPRTARC